MAQSFGTACDTKYDTQWFYLGDIRALVRWTDDTRMDSCKSRISEPFWDSVVVVSLRFHRRLRDLANL